MNFVWRGFQVLRANPEFRPFFLRPLLVSIALYFAVVLIGWFMIVPPLQGLLGRWNIQPGVVGTTGTVAYLALLWFITGPLFITFATIASAFMWEKLSHKVEAEVYGSAPPAGNLRPAEIVTDNAMRIAHGLTLTCCLSLISLFFWPITIVIGGWLGMHDFTAPALLRRHVLFHRQTGRVFKSKGWFGFALTAGVFALVPFLNLLLLPAMVAGGTILIAESEGRASV